MIARPDALYGERGGRRSSAGRPFKIFEISPTITHRRRRRRNGRRGGRGGRTHEIGSRRRGQCILDWEKSGRRSLKAINNHDGPKIHPSERCSTKACVHGTNDDGQGLAVKCDVYLGYVANCSHSGDTDVTEGEDKYVSTFRKRPIRSGYLSLFKSAQLVPPPASLTTSIKPSSPSPPPTIPSYNWE